MPSKQTQAVCLILPLSTHSLSLPSPFLPLYIPPSFPAIISSPHASPCSESHFLDYSPTRMLLKRLHVSALQELCETDTQNLVFGIRSIVVKQNISAGVLSSVNYKTNKARQADQASKICNEDNNRCICYNYHWLDCLLGLNCRELQRCFDLFYYDGLANQREQIRLTISERKPSKEQCALLLLLLLLISGRK